MQAVHTLGQSGDVLMLTGGLCATLNTKANPLLCPLSSQLLRDFEMVKVTQDNRINLSLNVSLYVKFKMDLIKTEISEPSQRKKTFLTTRTIIISYNLLFFNSLVGNLAHVSFVVFMWEHNGDQTFSLLINSPVFKLKIAVIIKSPRFFIPKLFCSADFPESSPY